MMCECHISIDPLTRRRIVCVLKMIRIFSNNNTNAGSAGGYCHIGENLDRQTLEFGFGRVLAHLFQQ